MVVVVNLCAFTWHLPTCVVFCLTAATTFSFLPSKCVPSWYADCSTSNGSAACELSIFLLLFIQEGKWVEWSALNQCISRIKALLFMFTSFWLQLSVLYSHLCCTKKKLLQFNVRMKKSVRQCWLPLNGWFAKSYGGRAGEARRAKMRSNWCRIA